MASLTTVHTQSQLLGRCIGKAELSGSLCMLLCGHIRVSQSVSHTVSSTTLQYYSWHNSISSERSHRDLNCGLQSKICPFTA